MKTRVWSNARHHHISTNTSAILILVLQEHSKWLTQIQAKSDAMPVNLPVFSVPFTIPANDVKRSFIT